MTTRPLLPIIKSHSGSVQWELAWQTLYSTTDTYLATSSSTLPHTIAKPAPEASCTTPSSAAFLPLSAASLHTATALAFEPAVALWHIWTSAADLALLATGQAAIQLPESTRHAREAILTLWSQWTTAALFSLTSAWLGFVTPLTFSLLTCQGAIVAWTSTTSCSAALLTKISAASFWILDTVCIFAQCACLAFWSISKHTADLTKLAARVGVSAAEDALLIFAEQVRATASCALHFWTANLALTTTGSLRRHSDEKHRKCQQEESMRPCRHRRGCTHPSAN
jgi:hypothetical protein